MADLGTDTTVTAGPDRYGCVLSTEWNAWGPQGGYLTAVALRAVGEAHAAHGPGWRPASVSCHFLRPASFGPGELRTTLLRATRAATVTRVSLHQAGGDAVLEATVRAVAGDLPGPARRWSARPEAPPPEELTGMDELAAAEGAPLAPIWRVVELRPIGWAGLLGRAAAEPRVLSWYRLRPRAEVDGPWLDAGRAAVLLDLLHFPAVTVGFDSSELTFTAPSLDLDIAFHRPAPTEPWLLGEGRGTAAGGGLLAAVGRLWSHSGELLATGSQQMLHRPSTARR
jgi:acyl-CoA thioesterase